MRTVPSAWALTSRFPEGEIANAVTAPLAGPPTFRSLAGSLRSRITSCPSSEPASARLPSGKKRIDKLTRVFFDKQQSADFATVYPQREEERVKRAAAESRDRVAAHDAATRKLQSNPRIGDRTALGTIVDLRPPLALVQYDERYRSLSDQPAAEWLRIDGLSAASVGP